VTKNPSFRVGGVCVGGGVYGVRFLQNQHTSKYKNMGLSLAGDLLLETLKKLRKNKQEKNISGCE